MLKLLKKEFLLSMHPTTPIMILLSAMVLIPNYPYVVMFFYAGMAIFFTCLLGRENKDITYTLNLPVTKASIVKSRILFSVIIEMIQMILMIPFCYLGTLVHPQGNQAGMDGNLALFAMGFLSFAIFNAVFFISYYKNVSKVGISFIKSGVAVLVFAIVDPLLCYTVPFFDERITSLISPFCSYHIMLVPLFP